MIVTNRKFNAAILKQYQDILVLSLGNKMLEFNHWGRKTAGGNTYTETLLKNRDAVIIIGWYQLGKSGQWAHGLYNLTIP